MTKHIKAETILTIIYILTLGLFGGYYGWGKCISGVAISCGILFLSLNSNNKKQKEKHLLKTPWLMFILALLTLIWAQDWTCDIEGIIYMGLITGWIYFTEKIRASEDYNQLSIWSVLPWVGALIVIIALIALVTDATKAWFWQAERLGGVFQYSNTCALFMLICIVIIANGEFELSFLKNNNNQGKIKVRSIVVIAITAILIMGLLLTGSRSVQMIAIIWAICHGISNKSARIKTLIWIVGAFILAVIYVLATGSVQNVGRLFSVVSSNSTLWGRLLYDIDGVKTLIKNPLGMGYMGYYHTQGTFQTGIYITRYVHNDFLQAGLDYGVPAMIVLIFFVVYQLIKGGQSRFQKTILVIISVASLMDFHLQFAVIVFIAALCLDYNCELPPVLWLFGSSADKRKIKKTIPGLPKNAERIMAVLAGIVCVYFSVVYSFSFNENYTKALKLFPQYTEALEDKLIHDKTPEEAIVTANLILKSNESSSKAYRYLAYARSTNGDYLLAMEAMDKSIELDRYNTDLYKEYDSLISEMMITTDNEETKTKLSTYQNELLDRRSDLADTMNPIAFKLKDQLDYD